MQKELKIIISAFLVLLVCGFIFSFDTNTENVITGQATWRGSFSRLNPINWFRKVTPDTPIIKPTPTAPAFSIPSYTPIRKVRKAPFCKDTDGFNIYKKGLVNSNSYQAYDICDWDDSTYVWERYCDDTIPKSTKVSCAPEKCYDGACIKFEPEWVWDIDGLASKRTTAIWQTTPGIIEKSGPIIGVKNNFVKVSDEDNPISIGECYMYPNDYSEICLDSLTTDDPVQANVVIKGVPKDLGGPVVRGGITEDIPLGNPIAGSTLWGFDWQLDDSDLSGFQDTSINFQSKDYDIHEILALSKTSPSVKTSSDEVFMEVVKGSMNYYYLFDESINVSKATFDEPLEIKFLGKSLKIISVNPSGKSFTVVISDEYFMKAGDTVTVDGKKVTLENVGSGGAIQINVDGTIEVIPASTAETVNGIEIYNKETYYEDSMSERAALLLIGTAPIFRTYTNGDAYVSD